MSSSASMPPGRGSLRRRRPSASSCSSRPCTRFKDLKLLEHAHGLGFGGHFLSKSRAYSTTMGALRAARQRFARSRGAGDAGAVLDAWGRPEDEDLVERRANWFYLGWGYRTVGEAWLA